jgi:Raf kinase inhibitor-like YbhB/YbcL family protein
MTRIDVTSPSFEAGGTIPRRHTRDGDDVSPALELGAPPAGTRSLVILCEEPDAPKGTFVHWFAFNLSPETRKLGEGVPQEARLAGGMTQGTNDFGDLGYTGPAPPPGKPHRYFFRLYEVDRTVDLDAGVTKADLQRAISAHVVGEGEVMGTYGR